ASIFIGRSVHEIPLAFICPAHLSISLSKKCCKWFGELRSPGTGSAPFCCIRIFPAGVSMVVRMAAWSLSIAAAGVPLGKNAANQFDASKLVKPCSWAVAWAGRLGERLRVRIAIALIILL